MYELFFTGLLLALIFIWVTGYYPGGLIVPGYMVLFLDQPLRLAGTLAAALLAVALYRLASRWLILYGKRRFVFLIFTGSLAALGISSLLPSIFPVIAELRVIGWVIPGLIAIHFDRQGIPITTAGMAIVTAACYFAGQIIQWM